MAIQIFRQYPVINGFVQLPPNMVEDRTKYVVGNRDLVGTSLTNVEGFSDPADWRDVVIPKNAEFVEILAYTV
jgi:hypothetical protein